MKTKYTKVCNTKFTISDLCLFIEESNNTYINLIVGKI